MPRTKNPVSAASQALLVARQAALELTFDRPEAGAAQACLPNHHAVVGPPLAGTKTVSERLPKPSLGSVSYHRPSDSPAHGQAHANGPRWFCGDHKKKKRPIQPATFLEDAPEVGSSAQGVDGSTSPRFVHLRALS